MRIRRQIPEVVFGLILAAFLTGVLSPVYGQTTLTDRPQLIIKIRDIDKMLQDLEALMPSQTGADASSQMAMIKGMLQGTDWIDPSRAIVAGINYDGQTTSSLVLVPFQTPNENFRGAYGAIAGEDYYIMRFPPVPEMQISATERDYLVTASAASSETNILLEIAAHDLMVQSEGQIEASIQAMAANPEAGNLQGAFTPEEMQAMAREFLTTLKQVDTLRFGLNFESDAMLVLMDVKSLEDSYLAGLLDDQKADVRLGGYQPNYPMRYRSRPFNVAGVLQMLGASFSQIYSKMGFNFNELAEIAKGLTGEMAGGMAMDQNGMTLEGVYGLHPTINGETYLTQVYLPWFQNYNLQMAALMEEQTGQPVKPLYERTPDTIVAGQTVVGVRTRFPAMTPAGNQMPMNAILKDYETRLTAMDGLILMGSSDAIIEKLIGQSKGFQPSPAQGPLATFSMDMGAYLRGLQSLMPESAPTVTIPDDIGALSMQADMQQGELKTRTRIAARDIQQLSALFAALSTAGMTAGPSASEEMQTAEEETGADAPSASMPAPEIKSTPAYWMDRGGLLSAYGNYKGAIRSFQKALDLDPELAEAHFQQGIAYGELGQFDAAVTAISRAIDRNPTQGAYFYGRARVYLLAGDENLAMKDFMEAGFLGNEDARAYLKRAGVEWN